MAIAFLDSSALIKRYIAEAGSDWVVDLVAPAAANVIYISVISGAEVVSALTRRQRGGSLTAAESARIIAEFSDDWAMLYEVVRADREVVNQAMHLAQRYALRGYDAVQLASALELSALARSVQATMIFVSADDELNAAAVMEGLQVENPNLHP